MNLGDDVYSYLLSRGHEEKKGIKKMTAREIRKALGLSLSVEVIETTLQFDTRFSKKGDHHFITVTANKVQMDVSPSSVPVSSPPALASVTKRYQRPTSFTSTTKKQKRAPSTEDVVVEAPEAGASYKDISDRHNSSQSGTAETLEEFFFTVRSNQRQSMARGFALADQQTAQEAFEECGFFGTYTGGIEGEENGGKNQKVYINTHEPFCIATIGVQGGGKSHTLNTILETCLIPFSELNVVRLNEPMTVVVLHYDQNVTSMCEATGLVCPNPELSHLFGSPNHCVKKEDMVVLVSPTYYKQRKSFYDGYCTVKPLLLEWKKMTADHICKIMRLKQSDGPLYVATMLDLLRSYQREGVIPSFQTFTDKVAALCKLPGQEAALTQRLQLLKSVVLESAENESFRSEGGNLYSECRQGALVIVDLTDPLLSSADVNGIFQVLTEQFRAMPVTKLPGKVLALDEAHRYMDGYNEDGLSKAIVDVARLMRHDGMRLVISTQSPTILAPELLELITTVVIHRFHSKDWFSYLDTKLSLGKSCDMSQVMKLHPGQALVFASRHLLGDRNVFPINIRPRLTADRGASHRNIQSAPSPSSKAEKEDT
jgi:hypothetical protein